MIKTGVLCFSFLMFVQSGYAASFDCVKAATKIEKMICVDPELSELDEKLGRVYAKVSKSFDVQESQRNWLKYERGLSKDIASLKKVYVARIEYFQSILKYDFIPSKHSYPPYPDIWQLSFPLKKDDKHFSFYIAIYKTKNGNYLAYYTSYKGTKYAADFFEPGREIDPKSSPAAGYKLKYVKGESEVELASGVQIAISNLDSRYFQRCPQTLNYYYTLSYPNGRVVRKSLIRSLNEPEKEEIKERCASTIEKSYVKKVRAIDSNIYPLANGDFFLVDHDLGVVLRFDSNFQSKAALIGEKVFVVDTAELEKLGISEFEDMNYQSAQDAVFQYISDKK